MGISLAGPKDHLKTSHWWYKWRKDLRWLVPDCVTRCCLSSRILWTQVLHTVLACVWARVSVYVSLSVDSKPQEKRRPHHHRSILQSPGNSHAPLRPPHSPPSSSSSSSSPVCAGSSCPLPASISMTGLYSLQPPSLSTLLPSLQALPHPGLLSRLSPLLLQSLPPASSAPTGPTQDWITPNLPYRRPLCVGRWQCKC